jgi:hypothetical protein
VHFQVEQAKVGSIESFAALNDKQHADASAYLAKLGDLIGSMTGPLPVDKAKRNDRVYRRNPAIKGPMHAFGYSYIEDHLAAEVYSQLTLSGMLAYEALNLVNGRRSVSDIRDWLVAEQSAESGTVDLADVAAYLAALQSIGVVLL